MSGHTPGPWVLSQEDPALIYIPHTTDPFGMYAISEHSHYRDEEDEANARLIAAAPELYDSLKELLEICRSKCSPLDEQLLPNKTNHQALIDACHVLDRIREDEQA